MLLSLKEKTIKYRHKEVSMEEVKQIELRNYTRNLTRNLGIQQQLGGALQRWDWQAKLDKHTGGQAKSACVIIIRNK